MRKLLPLSVVALFAVTLGACEEAPTQMDGLDVSASRSAHASERAEGTFIVPTWGNDVLWDLMSPKLFGTDITNPAGQVVFGSPSDEASHEPFYIIGPDAGNDGAQSTEFGLGPHDHTVSVPPGNRGTFNANWHIHVVFPAEGGDVASSGSFPTAAGRVELAHAADVDGDSDLEDLTSSEKVQEAETRGHVNVVPTATVFVCPVRPQQD